jgi:hypothetical protein
LFVFLQKSSSHVFLQIVSPLCNISAA